MILFVPLALPDLVCPSLQIFETFPFRSILLSVLLDLCNPPCNGRGFYENGNTSFYCECWARSIAALAI